MSKGLYFDSQRHCVLTLHWYILENKSDKILLAGLLMYTVNTSY